MRVTWGTLFLAAAGVLSCGASTLPAGYQFWWRPERAVLEADRAFERAHTSA